MARNRKNIDVDHLYEVAGKPFQLCLKKEQKEVITYVLSGQNVFAMLPTGFGKSMCYILPSLLKDAVSHCSIYIVNMTYGVNSVKNGHGNNIFHFLQYWWWGFSVCLFVFLSICFL